MAATYYTFIIITSPTNATVKMNGETTNRLSVTKGTVVDWVVSCSGYKTQSGSVTVGSNQTLTVELEPNDYTFTINPTPSDAIVIINGVPTNSVEITMGSTVEWSVSKNGYRTQSGSIVVTQNHIFDVILTVAVKKDVFLGNFICPEIYLGDQSVSAIYAGPTLIWGVPAGEDVPTDVRSVVVSGVTAEFSNIIEVDGQYIEVYLCSGTVNIGANLYNVHISNTLHYVNNTVNYNSDTGVASFSICGTSPSTDVSATIY